MQDNRRPTLLEDQAHVELIREFSRQLTQYAQAYHAVNELERRVASVAGEAAQMAFQAGELITTDDALRWNPGPELFPGTHLCSRSTGDGLEFAIIERATTQGHARIEVLATGRDAAEVMRQFTVDQRQALRLWSDDVAAQVRERLAERYPGQDLSRVADSIRHRFTDKRYHHHHHPARHVLKAAQRLGI